MSLSKPKINESEPFQNQLTEDRAFRLDGIRVVPARTEYGDGQMVLLKVAGQSKELSLWGAYLIRQAESVEPGDLGKDYVLTRKVIPEFSERPVKALVPVERGEAPADF